MSLTELALLDGRRPLPLWDVIGLTLTLTQLVGFLGCGISPSQGRYLHAEQKKQNKLTQTRFEWDLNP
jgi:hypothetical protein